MHCAPAGELSVHGFDFPDRSVKIETTEEKKRTIKNEKQKQKTILNRKATKESTKTNGKY